MFEAPLLLISLTILVYAGWLVFDDEDLPWWQQAVPVYVPPSYTKGIVTEPPKPEPRKVIHCEVTGSNPYRTLCGRPVWSGANALKKHEFVTASVPDAHWPLPKPADEDPCPKCLALWLNSPAANLLGADNDDIDPDYDPWKGYGQTCTTCTT